jgi:NADPH-dependent 2,4-dienoyl-CoA reductase/sulfur reductase-like enzyme
MRLSAEAAHEFGGIELDRGKPLSFTLDGHRIPGFAGDTVLSATLAAGILTFGRLGESPIGLGPRFSPLLGVPGSTPLPMDRVPAVDGASLVSVGEKRRLPFRRAHSLGHSLDRYAAPAWIGVPAEKTLVADVLVIGGGIAGLSAADAAATAGKTVLLLERRPWLGGDARYFGPVGDEDNPAAFTSALIDGLRKRPDVTILSNAEVFGIAGRTILVHQIEVDGHPRGRVIAAEATDIVLATGAMQRLPVFSGNRLPGVISAVGAYHLAKRYGVTLGHAGLVATQGNYTYRLALRLKDAGYGIARIVDTRVNPQSRFVDFAKASGLTMGSGQMPLAATLARQGGLHISFANVGTSNAALSLDADALIVSGGFQPELSLWMLAGGRVRWIDGRLQAAGQLDHLALAGSAAGLKTMRACAQDGKAAVARLLGQPAMPVEDIEIGASFETPDDPTPIAPVAMGPAFLDGGRSLVARPTTGGLATGQALSLGDVAAAVDLGLISAGDAGAVAEERGAPGAPLAASTWTTSTRPPEDNPAFLAGRFGASPRRVQLIVDHKQVFETGALVYPNTAIRRPCNAIGVIAAPAQPGGIALMSAEGLANTDRFVVETLAGPFPARIKS